MRARLLWALLLLAAVFSMHGLSCAASDPGATSATSPATSVVTDTASDASTTSTVARALMGAALTPADMGSVALPGSGDRPTGHDVSLHTLMACLAVLAGAVGALLAAWLNRRRAHTAVLTPASRRPGVPTGRVRFSAPAPDLSRLCVLRV